MSSNFIVLVDTMQLPQLFALRPGTDNGSFITQGTLRRDLTKKWQSVKSPPWASLKTGSSLSKIFRQLSSGLGGWLPTRWPWLQGLPPGLPLPRARGESMPCVPTVLHTGPSPPAGTPAALPPLGKTRDQTKKPDPFLGKCSFPALTDL